MNPPTPPTTDRWPRQIKYIIGNEAVERFSYYGIRSILAGYITAAALNNFKGGLGYEKDTATEIIHMFTSANYLMPLLGAWFADKIAGRYNTILWVSMIYCLGNIVLACSGFAGGVHAKMVCLCAGLGLIAFGSGGIKPCVSAFMGDQFKPEQSHLLQKAYGAFYWAINFGSFFAFLVIPWIKNKWNFGVAFGVPGILMAVATLIFWLGTKYYVRKPTNRETKHAGFFTVFRSAWRGSKTTPWLPLLNVFATIGLPVMAMVLMTLLGFLSLIKYGLVQAGLYVEGRWLMQLHTWLAQTALSVFHCDWNLMRILGWSAFVCAVLWYLLVIVFSVLRKTELPESFLQQAAARHPERDIISARSLSPILFIFAFVPVFWALFDQTNSTWVMQGNQMTPWLLSGIYLFSLLLLLAASVLGAAIRAGQDITRTVFVVLAGVAALGGAVLLFAYFTSEPQTVRGLCQTLIPFLLGLGWLAVGIWGNQRLVRFLLGALGLGALIALVKWHQLILDLNFSIGAEEMQSANPAIVMGLVPLLTLLVYPRLGKLASPLKRMSYGMFIAAGSYVVVAALQKKIDGGAHLCVLWQTLPYLILTTAEVLVSTTGLEFAFREAAPEMKSAIMSFWLLTVTMGDLLVVTVTKLFASTTDQAASVSAGRFLQYAGMMLLVAVLFSVVAAFYQYRDKAAAQGK